MRAGAGSSIVAVILAGCSQASAPSADPHAPAIAVTLAPLPPPPQEPTTRAIAVPASASSASPSAAPELLIAEIPTTQGALLPLVAAQVARAKAKGLVPLVEFYADWCAPCKAFERSLPEPQMREALRGVLLIKLNAEDWQDKLKGTGYVVRSIPLFVLPLDDGRPSAKVLDGDKWQRPTPGSMAASLGSLLRGG